MWIGDDGMYRAVAAATGFDVLDAMLELLGRGEDPLTDQGRAEAQGVVDRHTGGRA
ncbi:MAG: hypothetical protein R2695_15760 [Acidimicrobiales bacterium]